jgi:hypothetical protein
MDPTLQKWLERAIRRSNDRSLRDEPVTDKYEELKESLLELDAQNVALRVELDRCMRELQGALMELQDGSVAPKDHLCSAGSEVVNGNDAEKSVIETDNATTGKSERSRRACLGTSAFISFCLLSLTVQSVNILSTVTDYCLSTRARYRTSTGLSGTDETSKT